MGSKKKSRSGGNRSSASQPAQQKKEDEEKKVQVEKTLNEYDYPLVLGEGSFGKVYKAVHRETNNELALKVISGSGLDEIQKEVAILAQKKHPNIIEYHTYLQYSNSLFIFMDYCAAGSVSDMMDIDEEGLQENQILFISKYSFQGLEFLHKHKIIHRDIKAANILVTQDAQIKLADFGVSAEVQTDQKRQTIIGTPYWMAPEVIASSDEGGYGIHCDIWSMGITCIEMAEVTPPHWDLTPMTALAKIPKAKSPTLKDPRKWSPDFSNFLSCCLIKDVEKRWSATELLAHPWIKELEKYKEQTLLDMKQWTKKCIEERLKEFNTKEDNNKESSYDPKEEKSSSTRIINDVRTMKKSKKITHNQSGSIDSINHETGTERIHENIEQSTDPTKNREPVVMKKNILLEKEYDRSYKIKMYVQPIVIFVVLLLFSFGGYSVYNTVVYPPVSQRLPPTEIKETKYNCYDILFTNRDFDPKDIDDRIRQLKKLFHPDRANGIDFSSELEKVVFCENVFSDPGSQLLYEVSHPEFGVEDQTIQQTLSSYLNWVGYQVPQEETIKKKVEKNLEFQRFKDYVIEETKRHHTRPQQVRDANENQTNIKPQPEPGKNIPTSPETPNPTSSITTTSSFKNLYDNLVMRLWSGLAQVKTLPQSFQQTVTQLWENFSRVWNFQLKKDKTK